MFYIGSIDFSLISFIIWQFFKAYELSKVNNTLKASYFDQFQFKIQLNGVDAAWEYKWHLYKIAVPHCWCLAWKRIIQKSPIWPYRNAFSFTEYLIGTVLQSHSLGIYKYFISDDLHYILAKNENLRLTGNLIAYFAFYNLFPSGCILLSKVNRNVLYLEGARVANIWTRRRMLSSGIWRIVS
jgi:hypothetical protein